MRKSVRTSRLKQAAQRMALQQKVGLTRFNDNRPESISQLKLQALANAHARNNRDPQTGLPRQLKQNVEQRSGYALDDVKVHYNSPEPAQMQAHAYAQGTDIHLSPGQEKHLPHETWHVVQQKQGRVKPTGQLAGTSVPINDNPSLEQEADTQGKAAVQQKPNHNATPKQRSTSNTSPIQYVKYNKKERDRILKRLRDAARRNQKIKAKPRRFRKFYKHQRKYNYGYKNRDIFRSEKKDSTGFSLVPYDPSINSSIKPQYEQFSIDGINGYYRNGFGGQPFLYLDKDKYDDSMIPSNYDDIIKNFKGNDSEVALQVLSMIESEGVSTKDKMGQAKSLFVLLTQIIEAHSTRIPGSDKLARALLRRIALGQLTFQQAFNRKNGLFVSAWAKGAKASRGGQEAARVLFGLEPKKSHTYTMGGLEKDLGDNFNEVLKTVDDYYSDDSDDEFDEDEDYDMSDKKNSDYSYFDKGASDRVLKQLFVKVNNALQALGLAQLKDPSQLPSISLNLSTIKKSYYRLALVVHPDRSDTGDAKRFQSISEAYKFLQEIAGEYKETNKINVRRHAINTNLNNLGLDLRPINGDGNCFYSAILDQLGYLNNYQGNGATIRERIAQLILDNQNVLSMYAVGNTLNTIVNQILSSHSWNNQGGDFAPQLIATVLQRNVRIVSPTGVTIIRPHGGLTLNRNNTLYAGTGTITIVYNGANHYDSTRTRYLM